MRGFAWENLITPPSRTALAIVGLTIPFLAFLGLFSISRGIRDLVGGTIASPSQETWQFPSGRRP
jgi:hypothetical protein